MKDTSQKRSLLHHLVVAVLENFPEASDLQSELEPLARAARTNYDSLASDLVTMGQECDSALSYIKTVSHEGTDTELLVQTFLKDVSGRIKTLKKIEKKVRGRFSRFLDWLGIPPHVQTDYPPHLVAKIVTDFSLQFKLQLAELRDSREREATLTLRRKQKTQRKSAPALLPPEVPSSDLEQLLVRSSVFSVTRGRSREGAV